MSILTAGVSLELLNLARGSTTPLIAPMMRGVEYTSNWQNANVLPDPATATEAWKQSLITDASYQEIMSFNGITIAFDKSKSYQAKGDFNKFEWLSSIWDQVKLAATPFLSIIEAITLNRRGVLSDKELTQTFMRHGWKKEEHWDQLKAFGNEIPGPADLVHFVLRHGFEPSVIAANQLSLEFPQSARDWFAKQGLNYEFPITDPFTNETVNTTWADMYWQTHWIPISPTQAFQMLQRLRPNRIANFSDQFPGITAFTLTDVNRWLRINDFPPGIRTQLAAMSYNVLTRRDVTSMYQLDIMDYNEVKEQYQDMGYNLKSATQLADLAKAKKVASKNKDNKVVLHNAAKKLYLGGVIDLDTFKIQYYRSTFKDKDELGIFDLGDKNYQLGQANDDVETTTAADSLVLERQLAVVNRMVASYKRAYLRGQMTADQISGKLNQLGLQNDHILSLFQEWDLLFSTHHKEVSAATVLQWAKDGIISVGEADIRLSNLGYSVADALNMTATVNQYFGEQKVKQSVKDAKTVEQQQKALIDQQKKLAAQQAKARADLAKYATPPQLVKWYAAGNIGLPEMTERLSVILTNSADIAKWIKDAEDAKAKANPVP